MNKLKIYWMCFKIYFTSQMTGYIANEDVKIIKYFLTLLSALFLPNDALLYRSLVIVNTCPRATNYHSSSHTLQVIILILDITLKISRITSFKLIFLYTYIKKFDNFYHCLKCSISFSLT